MTPNDGKALEEAVKKQVVSIAVDADVLYTYVSGIIMEADSTNINHAVAIVGFG